ncbi:hypothetical protein C8Q78DRAFT_368250 [Trametes maxima]|nr:hypothetical protein C8Q78DRAFT_368250 [Trametes maxima]
MRTCLLHTRVGLGSERATTSVGPAVPRNPRTRPQVPAHGGRHRCPVAVAIPPSPSFFFAATVVVRGGNTHPQFRRRRAFILAMCMCLRPSFQNSHSLPLPLTLSRSFLPRSSSSSKQRQAIARTPADRAEYNCGLRCARSLLSKFEAPRGPAGADISSSLLLLLLLWRRCLIPKKTIAYSKVLPRVRCGIGAHSHMYSATQRSVRTRPPAYACEARKL